MFIDTHKIYRDLASEGQFSDIQANMLTRLVKDIAIGQMDQFATKQDLSNLEKRLVAKLEQGDADLRSEIAKLHQEIKHVQDRLTIRLGGIMAAGVGLIAALNQLAS